MKTYHTLALLAALLCSIMAFSQTEKGSLYLGGGSNLSMGVTNPQNQSWKYFNIAPSAEYFILKNFSIGTDLPYSFSVSRPDGQKHSFHTFGLSPYVKYYFGESAFKPFVGVKYEFESQFSKSQINGELYKNTSSTSILNFGGGFAYFINDKFAVNFDVGYGIFQPFNGSSFNNSLRSKAGFMIRLK